jgi:hypothetical protein
VLCQKWLIFESVEGHDHHPATQMIEHCIFYAADGAAQSLVATVCFGNAFIREQELPLFFKVPPDDVSLVRTF